MNLAATPQQLAQHLSCGDYRTVHTPTSLPIPLSFTNREGFGTIGSTAWDHAHNWRTANLIAAGLVAAFNEWSADRPSVATAGLN